MSETVLHLETTRIRRKADSTMASTWLLRFTVSSVLFQRVNERKIKKPMRWPGVALRLDKSDINVKHLSHLADTIARKILFTIRIFQLRTTFCVSD